MTSTSRRAPVFGPEPWATIAEVEWCHFDWWFALVAVTDFVGDLRSSLHSHRDVEAKLSHLADLRARMTAAGVNVSTLVAAAAEPGKATLAKARRKVLDQALEDRAMTDAMRDTPRAQLERRARYGHWDSFPVNPDRWYDKMAGRRPPAEVSKGRSFAVTHLMRERLARHDKTCRDDADRLALYRAFHTIGIEFAERGNDSYGNIGELRLEAFTLYLGIDWAAAGMEPERYWQDLCELLVSEVYALTYQHETLAFHRVRSRHAEMTEAILIGLADEYRAAYQADEALELVAWLHIAGRRYARYTDAARRLGSDHWMPIEALARSAIAGGRGELAVEVFRAANQPGMHRDRLRDRCLKLTGVRLDEPATRLRVVKE